MRLHANIIKVRSSVFTPAFLTFTRAIMLFIAYSLFGWFVETGFIAMTQQRFAPRGLISHGLPLIPLFGYCGWLIIQPLLRLKKWPLLVFACAASLTTLIELLTSLMNTYIFHVITWDYSNMPLSYHGRVALPVSVGWGLLSLVVVYRLDPVFKKLISRIKPLPMAIISMSILFYIIFCILFDLYQFNIR